MADSEEQKLVFCLAKAIAESRVTLKASKIRAALVQRRWSGQRGSSRERACQVRIFQSAVAELQSRGSHLPKIGTSNDDDAEVDALFHRLMKTDYPPGFEINETPDATLPSLDTALCQRTLQKILFYNRSHREVLEDLVSSLAFLGSEEERLASLPYMVIRKEAACPSLSIEIMTILREILVLARANLDKLEARKNAKALTLSQVTFTLLAEILVKARYNLDRLHKMASVASNNAKAKPSAQISDHYEELLCKFAFNEVGLYWKRLGVFLGFPLRDLNVIEQYCLTHRLDVGDMAWSMLDKYRNDKGKDQASVATLRARLKDVRSATVKSDADVTPNFSFFETDRLYGRESEMRNIEVFFWGEVASTEYPVLPITTRTIQIIAGSGGVGKTLLAKTYVALHRKAYSGGVFNFNCETYASLLVSLRMNLLAIQAMESASMENQGYTALSEKLFLFFKLLKSRQRCLILFDNADELELLRVCLPNRAISCHVLITTRSVKTQELCAEPNVRLTKLETLKGDSAVLALLGWAGKTREEFRQMREEEKVCVRKLALDPPVEGLPLALAHAGIYIEQQSVTFQSYWSHLRARAKELDPAALTMNKCLQYFHLSHLKEFLHEVGIFSPTDLAGLDVTELKVKSYNERLIRRAKDALNARRHLYLTWELDIDYIRTHSSEGYRLLQYCSLFASQDIPRDVVRDAAFSDTEQEFRDVVMAKGARVLKERSFLKQTEQNDMTMVYSMHHLIQASVLGPLMGNEDVCRQMLNSVGRCLVERLPPKSDVFDTSSVVSLLPHVYSVAVKLLEVGAIGANSPDIVKWACFLSMNFFHIETAKTLYEKRINLFTESPNSVSEIERRECYEGMCSVFFRLGDFESVKTYVELALSGRSPDQLTDGEIVSSFFTVLHHLAHVYVFHEMHSMAEKLGLMLLKACSSHPTADHAAADRGVFLVCLLLEHVYAHEEEFDKQLEILDKAGCFLSENNLDLATCLFSLQISVQLFLIIFFQVCVAYGGALSSLERFSEARDYFIKAIDIYKRYAMETDFRMAEVLQVLSVCYRSLGDFDKAIEVSKEALDIIRPKLPPGNIGLYNYLSCHAQNLNAKGEKRDAIELLQEAMPLLQIVSPPLGIKLETSSCFLLIGSWFAEIENYEAAIPYLQNGLSVCDELYSEKLIGALYSQTMAEQLGICYLKLKRFQDALPLLQRSFSASKECLEDNGGTVAALGNYIACLIYLKKFDEAETEIRETSQLFSHLPEEHPILWRLNSLYGVLCKRRVRNEEPAVGPRMKNT
ncbi:uncharacterized protein [Oscarella lobularis]|uniref:uncharacterized protein isoform X2 n=1 Tax=Oscarella lobularis TaxID=121494 RepID=UPI0033137D19